MYLDSAILVKLLIWEPDSHFYAKVVEKQVIFSSFIAYTEVESALLANMRDRKINEQEKNRAWAKFTYWTEDETIHLINLTPAILKKANYILEEVPLHMRLRSLDAFHLATCDFAQEWPLCTNDKRMREAAKYLRFPLSEIAS